MLEINVIKKNYGNINVLNNVYLNLKPKSIVSLVGSNGTGKTTLIAVVSGLTEFSGDVSLNNISLKNNYYNYIKNIGVVLDKQYMYDYMTVSEFIDFNAILRGVFYSDVYKQNKEEIMRLLYIFEYRGVLIKNLSLGTKQKVFFVSVIISRPKLLIMDEPLVNLDNDSKKNLIKYLHDYAILNESIIIIATHSREIINKLCTDIYEMPIREELLCTY